jgi:hypothetical protein
VVQEIDLDSVVLSPDTVAAWSEIALRLAAALRQLQQSGRQISEADIPIEQGRVEDDGTLTISVNVPGVFDASMTVPQGHWSRKQ